MNNFKVSGTKMTSRFGMSHSQLRDQTKYHSEVYGLKGPNHSGISKRQAKKCKHPKAKSLDYGNPESGGMGMHCPTCGFRSFHRLY